MAVTSNEQPHQQDENQQQPQQDEIQQHHQQDETTITTSAAAAAPTWTLNEMGVPVGVATSGAGGVLSAAALGGDGVGAVARDAVAPAGDGDEVDHEYDAITGIGKWKLRHHLLARAVLDRDLTRARKLARRMYAGPPLMGPV